MGDVRSNFTVTYTIKLCCNYPLFFFFFFSSARSRVRIEEHRREMSALQEKIISLKM